MDESFMHFSQIMERLLSIEGEIYDDENGIHSYIYTFEVGTPVELDIERDEQGHLKIGTVPPLYRVETSYRPSYHSIRFVANKINTDGEDS